MCTRSEACMGVLCPQGYSVYIYIYIYIHRRLYRAMISKDYILKCSNMCLTCTKRIDKKISVIQ